MTFFGVRQQGKTAPWFGVPPSGGVGCLQTVPPESGTPNNPKRCRRFALLPHSIGRS
jgi:hypothetical protein